MKTKEKVLEVLVSKKGDFISGNDLALNLGLSRNSIWKAINQLKEDGYLINSVKNQGYSLSLENMKVSTQEIYKYLRSDNYRFELYEIVDSTNSVCRQHAENGEKEGLVVISDEQTNGRGRQGKSFYSPSDSGIYMSILLRPKQSLSEALYITTASAVAVSEAVDAVTGINTKIKWVNDIYYHDKKVCGILTEASMDMESSSFNYIILGIGINVYNTKVIYPEEIRNIAAPVLENTTHNENIRNILIARVLDNFAELYEDISSKKYHEMYCSKSLLTGRTISYLQGKEECVAKVVDIDEEFRLIVENKDGEREKLTSGEVKLVDLNVKSI